ncbi:MAG: RNA polymerase sigma-70 factor [Tannerella sp.]|nr:RNA polymerase sigma-70 factor [Tannerella sp.]
MEEEKICVDKLASGNHDAFKLLFIKYFPKVKYFIAHLIKSEAIAEELAQDVFLKIWERRDKLSAVQSFSSYIYRMARNTSLNHLEHVYIEETCLKDYREEMDFSVEEELYAKETERLEQLTVSHMPPQRKAVYEMSRMQGLSNDEIAHRLNISKKTVENHLNLALKEIRKALSLLATFFLV